jgi:hypothetical protein
MIRSLDQHRATGDATQRAEIGTDSANVVALEPQGGTSTSASAPPAVAPRTESAAIMPAITAAPAQIGQSDANSATVAQEPQNSAATPSPTPQAVEPPVPPQEPAKRPRRRKVRRDRQHRVKTQRKRKPGRPTVFEKVFCEQGRKLVLEGVTNTFLAYFFSISVVTFYQWQKRYPAFKKALERGRKQAVAETKKAKAEADKAWENERRFL